MSKAEKFISDCTRNCSNEYWGNSKSVGQGGTISKRGFTPWLTPDQAKRAVEIEKEEVIERACEYLDGIIGVLNDRGHGLKKERIIGGLKQAMKGE